MADGEGVDCGEGDAGCLWVLWVELVCWELLLGSGYGDGVAGSGGQGWGVGGCGIGQVVWKVSDTVYFGCVGEEEYVNE